MALLAGLAGSCRAADSKSAAPGPKTHAEQQTEFETGFETGLLTIPVYAVMKQYYPDVYATSLKQSLDGLRAGKSILALQGDLRTVYLGLLKTQLPKADPRLVYQVIDMARTEGEILVSSPDNCMAFFGLGSFKTRVDLLFPAELQKRDLKLSADILQQTATHPYSRATDGKHDLPAATELASIAYDELPSDDSRKRFMRMGGNLAGATDPADQRVVCEYMLGFLTALMKQTPEDAAAIYVGASSAH